MNQPGEAGNRQPGSGDEKLRMGVAGDRRCGADLEDSLRLEAEA